MVDIDGAFPFPSYRTHQREILSEAATALFENEKQVVVIDAPTGIGKSGINVALCRLANDAFYTTPQKQLRNQLQNDDDLQHYYNALRARADYTCDVGTERTDDDRTYNCKNCPINQSDNSCRDYNCRYWRAKETAMDSQTAVLTFSYLIIDDRIPTTTADAQTESGQANLDAYSSAQISFDDRDLLVVDEAHTLEEQVASLHTGFKLSPRTLSVEHPDDLLEEYEIVDGDVDELGRIYTDFNNRVRDVVARVGSADDVRISHLDDAIEEVQTRVSGYKTLLDELDTLTEDQARLKTRLKSLDWRLDWMREELSDGRPWVVSLEDTSDDGPDARYKATCKPVKVDNFLQEHVWNRADKIVLSTATMPYRDDPDRWLERIGLPPEQAAVVSKPMPFPPENRAVKTDTMIGKMSRGRINQHWDAIIATLHTLRQKHAGEKGLIHTASYDRAQELYATFENDAVLHRDDRREAEYYVNRWQNSDNSMLLSPAMLDGVDLPGEMCRWQAMVKVPYPTLSVARSSVLPKAGYRQRANS